MRKTRIVNGFLAVALALSMLFPGMSVFAEDSQAGDSLGEAGETPVVTAAGELPEFTTELHKKPDGTGKVTEKDEIKLDTQLYFVIKKAALSDIAVNTEYTVTLPKGIKAPVSTADFDITTTINMKTVIFATIKATQSVMDLKVVFKDFDGGDTGHSDENCKLKLLKSAHMYFGCNLDKDNLKKEDDQGKVSISMSNGDEVKFTLSEFKPQAPKLEKTVGIADGNGIAEWTVTYTNAVGAYDEEKLPTVLTDTLPEGLEYVDSSATVSVGGVGSAIDESNFKHENGVITYTLPETLDDGQKVELKYKTKLSNKVMSDIWSNPNVDNKYMNFAEAKKDSDSLNPKLEAKKELVIPSNWAGREMLSKSGTVSDDKRSIDWTVTVNTASRGFEHLYVIDTMGKGLELNENSIAVTDGASIVSFAKGTETVDGKIVMTIKLVDGGNPSSAAAKYVIKYTTKIKDAYFDPNSTEEFDKNDVSNKGRC